MGNFKKYISETRGRLDLSLQSANKYLSNKSRRDTFIDSPIIVEQKSNGLKLTLVKQANTGQAESDYILACEGNIIYPDEFSYDTKTNIRRNSKGLSQLALVWEHLRKLRKNNIPVGTELFIEYSMNTTKHNGTHEITLIGHTNSTWNVKQGVLITTPEDFNTSSRDIFAKALNVKTPSILFEGVISSQSKFADSIDNKLLKDVYRKSNLDWSRDNIIGNISSMFLEAISKDDEIIGVVIKYNDNKNDVVLKLQERNISESKYSSNTTDDYKTFRDTQVKKVVKKIHSKNMQEAIGELAKAIKDVDNSVYDVVSFREDIQAKAREIISRKMPGNKGVMFIGKFMDISEGIKEFIREATIKYDTVTVVLLSSKDTRGTKLVRNNMFREAFSGIEIINTSITNVDNIINKSHNIIAEVITEDKMEKK